MLASTLAAGLALLGTVEVAQTAKRKPSCSRAGSKTVLKNSTARVFEVRGGVRRLYGCLHRSGKRIKLTETYDDGYVQSTDYSHVRLAGRFVAWREVSEDVSCKAACPPSYDATTESIEIYDLRQRRARSLIGSVVARALFLSDRGGVAWAQRSSDGQLEVWVASGNAGTRVDKGIIPASSLRLRSDTLVWTKGGVEQTAPLP